VLPEIPTESAYPLLLVNIDNAVDPGVICSSLTGANFDTSTGEFNWTPYYDQAGSYEFKIVGTDGELTDFEMFVVNVADTTPGPYLDEIENQNVVSGYAITQIDAADGGDDFDAGNDPITILLPNISILASGLTPSEVVIF